MTGSCLYARLFAFELCVFCGAAHGSSPCPGESDIVKQFKVLLQQKDGRTFEYVVEEALGFRSAYTDAKRQHDAALVIERTPVFRLEITEVLQ